jgi:DNA-binding CsgD family transcriptional regulator
MLAADPPAILTGTRTRRSARRSRTGLPGKEISRRLVISERTGATTRPRCWRTYVSSRIAAVREAARLGIATSI